ncbi:DUF1858 domain-containing protein [Candidatus Woesearchaeota archaeon]|nr:DUF1858 domain-containing protein [Candidatus Woesearchaeota archaeon]
MTKTKTAKITKDMTLGEVITKHPESAEIMAEYGLHCIGCHVAAWESVEEGAKAHGLNDEKVKEMLDKMNKAVEGKK